jgi:hypothetical protein
MVDVIIVFKASVKRRLGAKAHQGVEASHHLSFLSKASRRRATVRRGTSRGEVMAGAGEGAGGDTLPLRAG